jgi:arginase family enzyme
MLELIGIPSENGSLGKNAGCRKAPQAISRFLRKRIRTIPVFEQDVEKTQETVFRFAWKIFSKKRKRLPIFLGGDHSITYSLFKAFAKKNKMAGLLVLDAHADSAVFFKPVSHEDFNRVLVEEKALSPRRLLLVGVRKTWPVEQQFLKRKKIQVIPGHAVRRNFAKAERELNRFLDSVPLLYLSIDIDALDPSVAPATGYLEKSGLSKKTLFRLLEIVVKSGKLRGADLVEINPTKTGAKKTVQLACEIVRFLERNAE